MEALGLILGLVLVGVLLRQLAGPPRLPASLPTLDGIAATLRSSDPDLTGLSPWLFLFGWALWAWVVLSVLLQATLAALDMLTRDGSWVRALRPIVDHFTASFTRRLVTGITVTILIAQLSGRGAPRAGAVPMPVPVTLMLPAPGDIAPISQTDRTAAEAGASIEHPIIVGDTLLTVSARYYGTEEEYRRLLTANRGRYLSSGAPFAGVLVPGETLLVPPAILTMPYSDDNAVYTVEAGDTLRRIAARFLGDEMRWPEIFALNRGTARLPDGRTLTNPDLIWPGLRLVIPVAPPDPAPPPAPSCPPDEPPPLATPASPPTAPPAPTPTPVPAAPPRPAQPSPAATGVPPATPAVVTPVRPTASPGDRSGPAAAASGTPSRPSAGHAAATHTRAVAPASPTNPPPVAPAPVPEQGDTSLALGIAGLGAAAATGAAFLAARERRRRLRAPTTSPPAIAENAAGPDLARDFAHRRHGVTAEPAVLVVAHAARFFAEEGLPTVTILAAHQGKRSVTLIVDVPHADWERLAALAPVFGARLGGRCEATRSITGDAVLRLTGLAALDLVAAGEAAEAPPLLPLGVLGNRETFYGNWHALGHVLVAGLPGEVVDAVLTGLIAALTATRSPDQLHLWTIARRRVLPTELRALPHLAAEPIDADDSARVHAVLAGLRDELFRRMREATAGAASANLPDLVLIAGELADLRDDGNAGTTLDLLGREGPAYGIRLLVATARPEALDETLLAYFATRLVLRLLDEEHSLRLLGLIDAADLGGDGWLILRLAGRRPLQPDGWAPLRLRGIQIPPEGLAALVQQMLAAWGGAGFAPSGPATTPADPVTRQIAPSPGEGDAMERGDTAADGRERRQDVVVPNWAGMTVAGSDTAIDATDNAEGKAGSWQGEALFEVVHVESLVEEDCARSTMPRRLHMPVSAGQDSERVSLPTIGYAPVQGAGTTMQAGENAAPDAPGNTGREGIGSALGQPIEVRCFGVFQVCCGDRPLSPEGQHRATYKAWELLAFLAASPPGPISRDTLLTALWSHRRLNPHRPANPLHVAVTRLRQALAAQVPDLPAEVLRAERDGTYRLDPDLVVSDVHRFLALREAAARLPLREALAAHAEAFALYRDELLAGAGYPWVDERFDGGISLPEHYRAAARDFTSGLARRCVRENRCDLAVPLYRRLLDAEPTHEGFVRELYRCYGTLGDRRALLRAERALRQALREEYADPDEPDDPALYEPEPATVNAFQDALAMVEARAKT